MRRAFLGSALLLAITALAVATAYASPGPNAQGAPVAAPTPPSYYNPGDNAGALGRTYTIFKTNDSLTFIDRNTGAVTSVSDDDFWSIYGTRFYGGTSISAGGDGRALYDPYGPCGDGQGHWLFVELGSVKFSDGTTEPGIFIAASDGDSDEVAGCDSFSQPSGSPGLGVESPLVPRCLYPGYLAADVWTGSGGSFGPYSTTTAAGNGNAAPVWQVLIPPATPTATPTP